MKHIFRFILFVFFSLMLLSCAQSDEPFETPFSFNIAIKDTAGNPVQGYEVYVRNKLSIDEGNVNRPAVTIPYKIAEECNLQINIYDLHSRLLTSIFYETINAGTYYDVFILIESDSGEPINGSSIVLKYNMLATEINTGEVLFEDTKFMCRYFASPQLYSIGNLDSNGDFLTENKLYFPHLFELPELKHISPDNIDLGTFTINDEVVITIYDSENEVYQTFERTVEHGSNHFELIWDEAKRQKAAKPELKSNIEINEVENRKVNQRASNPENNELYLLNNTPMHNSKKKITPHYLERPESVNIRFQQNGIDIEDLTDFHFSVELVSGSGDLQDETSFTNGFNYFDIGLGTPNSFLNFDLDNFSTTWEADMDFELSIWEGEGDSVNIVLNCGFIADGFGYYGWGFYGGDTALQVPVSGEETGNIDWGYGATGNVTGGTPSNPGYGYGTGLPNEDILADPTDAGYYFILTIEDDAPVDVTLCIDQIAFGYVPFNLAFWVNGEWNYEPEDGSQVYWTNPGTTNACITFTIDATRADVPIVLFGPDDGPHWPPPPPTVTNEGEYILISWTVENEIEMSYYRVYRDGLLVAQVEALNEPSTHIYEVIDTPEYEGTYYYTIEAVANNGTNQFWGPIPVDFFEFEWQLHQNYPNPFN